MAVHFEIHVDDIDKAEAFYGTVLGWSFTSMPGGEDMAYRLIEGDEVGATHGVTAALMKRADESPKAGGPIRGCTLVVPVADTDATYKKALAHGGAEALPPTDYPGVGRAAYCEDGQGNVFGFITSENGDI